MQVLLLSKSLYAKYNVVYTMYTLYCTLYQDSPDPFKKPRFLKNLQNLKVEILGFFRLFNFQVKIFTFSSQNL